MEVGNTIMLDSSGDIVLDDKLRVPILSQSSKVQQDIAVIIKSAKGSLASDPRFGTDIVGIVNAKGDQAITEGLVRDALQQYAHTKYINAITVTTRRENREIYVTATVTLADKSVITIEATA